MVHAIVCCFSLSGALYLRSMCLYLSSMSVYLRSMCLYLTSMSAEVVFMACGDKL